ncbi:MAG: exodeoxyribonuclease VII large subunit [Cardiobacteriaceae bacterium]|nr:exodeoxyribonuclease VII large subunit [Cardiobacteriaceae bacterium]
MHPSDHTYTVSELNQTVRHLLEHDFASIRVEGEISNLSRPASGHLYFSLKDPEAQIACALFKGSRYSLKIPLRDLDNGLAVRAHGRLSLYEARGSYQLIVHQLEPLGRGDLERAYLERQTLLASEGHFDPARKRPIPAFPRAIGIITSPTGAAIHDALTTLARRNPAIPVILYPSAVQGESAAAELIAQIATANRRNECDTLLLIRGGGSLEDLWSFNHPDLIRAISASRIPVISGVGHETDITLADLAADLRAPTPTAAAELACPPQSAILAHLAQQQTTLDQRIQRILRERQQQRDTLARRLQLQHPERRLQQQIQRADELRERLRHSISRQLERQQQRFSHLARTLHTLSPLATLARGYAIVHNAHGDIITSAQQTQPKEDLHIRLNEGKIICTVRQRRQTPAKTIISENNKK